MESFDAGGKKAFQVGDILRDQDHHFIGFVGVDEVQGRSKAVRLAALKN